MVVYEFQNDESLLRTLAELNVQEKSVARKRLVAQVVFAVCAVVVYYLAFNSLNRAGINVGNFDAATRIPSTRGAIASSLIYFVAATVIMVCALMFKRIQASMYLRSTLRLDKDFLTAHGTWTFSEDAIRTDSTRGKGEIPWSTVATYGDHGKYLYIQRKDQMLYLVDRTRLSDAELSELRNLLEQHVTAES